MEENTDAMGWRLRGWDEELGYPEFKEDAERAMEAVRKRMGVKMPFRMEST